MLLASGHLPADCIETAITFGLSAPTEHYGLAVVQHGFMLRPQFSAGKVLWISHGILLNSIAYRGNSVLIPR